MSEEAKGSESIPAEGKEPVQDITNFKAEMGRKFDNTNTELATLKQQNQQVLAALDAIAQSSVKKPAGAEEDDEDLMYSNPAEYRRKMKDEIKTEVNQDVDAKTAANQTYQNTVYELVTQFPELNVAESDMYKATMKILDTYPKTQRNESATMRAASYQAAANLELAPKPKRKSSSDDDSFSLSAGFSGSKKGKSPVVNSDMLTIASLFGLNLEDKKVMESLEKHANRDTYTSWR